MTTRYFFTLCFLFASFNSFSQDSIRVTLCESSGSTCFGYPTLNKTIEYFDSTGLLVKTSFFNFERCDEEYADTAFRHLSDSYFTYDSSGNVLTEDQFSFDEDTVVSNHWQFTYTYDSAGHQLIKTNVLLFPAYQPYLYDSTVYNQAGSRVYYFREEWNSTLSALDTSRIQTWTYDSLERQIQFDIYVYFDFTFYNIAHTYIEYDTASNVISQTYSNSANSDSSRFLTSYDLFNRKIETWGQDWDTLSGFWLNTGHATYEYDSLHLLVKYIFSCIDSLCNDTARKSEYSYDMAGHLTQVNNYLYDGPGWTFSGNEYTTYDSWDYIIHQGWWEVDFEGCDESMHHDYDYNADHQLIHSHSLHYTCDYHETDCYYYALDQDSILIVLHTDQFVCPYDTALLNVTVAGGTPPYTYSWSPGNLLLDSTVESPLSFADTTTIFTLTVTDSLGLVQTGFDTLKVYQKNIHPVTIVISPPACYGTEAWLSFDTTGLQEPYNALWYLNGTPYLNNVDTLFTSIPGSYSMELTSGVCNLMSDSVQPAFLPDPGAQIVLLGDSIFCNGGATVLQSNIFPSIHWNTGDTTDYLYVTATGNYFAVVIDSNSCADTSNSISITVHPLPLINLGSDSLVCINQPVNLDAGTGFVNYIWQDGSTMQTLQVFSATPDTIDYSVLVTDSNSCVNSDTIEVIYDACLGLTNLSDDFTIDLFPNPVTGILSITTSHPNGKEITLSIYNAIGDKLITSFLHPYQTTELDVSSLSPGIYLLEAQTDGFVLRKKFLKK